MLKILDCTPIAQFAIDLNHRVTLWKKACEKLTGYTSQQMVGTMPKMTGVELTRKLLAIKDALPVILCSGFSAGITERNADSMGIRAILNKPILKHEMAQTVRNVLDGVGV